MKRKSKTVVVLGAGISGLTAAYTLSKNGFDVYVIEKNSYHGGLSATFSHKNYLLDYGPHNFHTHIPNVLKFVKDELGIPLTELSVRSSKLFFMGKLIDYPIKVFNAMKNLNFFVGLRCFISFVLTRIRQRFLPQKNESSFEDWVKNRFGQYLYNLYFGPYVKKVWGIPANQLDIDIARQRIPDPSLLALIVRGLSGIRFYKKHTEDLSTTESYYPPKGIGTISDKLTEIISNNGGKILYNGTIKEIAVSKDRHRISFDINGKNSQIECDYIINTIPISEFYSKLTAPGKDKILIDINYLKYRSLILLYMFLNIEKVFDYPWVYFNEQDNPGLIFNRVSEIGGFSKEMINKKKGVICLEITSYRGEEIWQKTDVELFNECITYLEKNNFLRRSSVEEIITKRLENAYPIFRTGYKTYMRNVLNYLADFNNIICLGRQGLFTYANMDHCIDMGLKLDKLFKNENLDAKDFYEIYNDYLSYQ